MQTLCVHEFAKLVANVLLMKSYSCATNEAAFIATAVPAPTTD